MTDPWMDRLSEYVDGDLDAETRLSIEAHLATCAECRATREELERVVSRAKRVAYRAPATDLWQPIETAIANQRDKTLPATGRRRLVTMSVGRLAAAAAVVAMAVGGITWTIASKRASSTIASSGAPDSATSPSAATGAATAALAVASYREAVADLERVLEAGRATLRPETMSVIEANLRAIDLAIAQADSALRRDPGSDYLNQYLAATMQRKLKLLRRAVEITTARS